MTHPVLAALFAALDRGGIAWALQRVPSNPAAPTGDVDLFVARSEAAALRRVAEAQGFVALPGWSEPPELVLIQYDRASDRWLVLDVATAVAFDRGRVGLAAPAPALLARRRRHGELWVPDAEDGFWLLVLHCLLDKGAVPGHYAPRLRDVPGEAGGPVAAALADAVGAGAIVRLRRAAAATDWDALLAMAGEVRASLRAAAPLRDRLERVATRAARVARKPLLIRRRRGVSVALLGPNGAGKSTLAGELRARLPVESDLVYMGLWKADGDGRGPGFGAALRRPARMWRRYARAVGLQLRGHVVVFDRYVHDAHLPPGPPLVPLKRIYLRALTRALPAPDLAVVLDVPPEVAFARKGENTVEELRGERDVYRALPRAAIVDASGTRDEVRVEVTQLLWGRLADRWRGRAAR